jgi:lipopolysaccharide/colanic/teichoic acid biosynthesis glycosyltransferase
MQSVEEIRGQAAQLPADDRRPGDGALRALDVVVAAGGVVLLSPALLLVGLAILLTSGRPLLYRGLRVGRDGRFFQMYKFRTLTPDAESRLGPYYGEELTLRTEAELTKLGAWLRAAQLDELPQLWNVLRGDMSMVGPRPIRPALFEQVVRDTPESWRRLVIRPGLSGLAQTRIGREEAWAEKLAHDLEYIAERSVGLYLRGGGTMIVSFLAHVASAFAELGHGRTRRRA